MKRPADNASQGEYDMYFAWATVKMARGISTGRVRHGQVRFCRGWRRHVMKKAARGLYK